MVKKVLIVSMANSIHTKRWISQLQNLNFKIYLFSSLDLPIYVKYNNHIKLVGSSFGYIDDKKILFRLKKYFFLLLLIAKKKIYPDYLNKRLIKVINRINPDLIHTLETQHSGYLLLDSLPYLKRKSIWWHTNWGSDFLIYSKFKDHNIKISSLLSKIDYYSCECQRDLDLALKLGYFNDVHPVYPNTGGFHIDKLIQIKSTCFLPSKRKSIILKGYQGWAGRALVAFRALEKCVDILNDYNIYVFSNTLSNDIVLASKLFEANHGINVTLVPEDTAHDEILRLQGLSRIYIGLSIGDGISTSLLESMAMGSFPIQSCTACAEEWIENDISGFIVPPEDPDIIELAIRRALIDDDLVDKASYINFKTIENKAEYHNLKNITINSYKKLLNLPVE